MSKYAPALCLLATLLPTLAVAQASMPNDLRGEYTFETTEQCGYLTVTATGFTTAEDLGCTVSKLRRLSGSPGERSSFQAEFSCRVDDPKKVAVKGLLELAKLRDNWVLAMHLTVNPKDSRRVTLPALQVFAKCGMQAFAQLPIPKQGQCPSGYRERGGYCVPLATTSPNAVGTVGQCPSGWMQSGTACIRMPR